jgi:hypothetical protein
MMFANKIFSAKAAHDDDQPAAAAEWVTGDAHLYRIFGRPLPGDGNT